MSKKKYFACDLEFANMSASGDDGEGVPSDDVNLRKGRESTDLRGARGDERDGSELKSTSDESSPVDGDRTGQGSSSPPRDQNHEVHEVDNSEEDKKKKIDELLKSLNCTMDGLSEDEANRRLGEYGLNKLEEKSESPILKYLSFLNNPLSWTMGLAGLISVIMVDWIDMILIICLLFGNATLAYHEEVSSGDAVKSLQSQLATSTRCIRGGKYIGDLSCERIVPGDILCLKLGNVVPADCYLMESQGNVRIDESSLTGESLLVSKFCGDKVYSGSIIKQGEFKALVYATGSKTFYGNTAMLIGSEVSISHVQKVLQSITWFCIMFIVIGVILELAIQFGYRHKPCRSLSNCNTINNCLVIIVGGIPIAMPTVLSVMMAFGAMDLAKKEAIVVRMTAIEEIAAMEVLCSDKTGTLTLNHLKMNEPVVIEEGYDRNDVVIYGALVSPPEDKDAIDKAIEEGCTEENTRVMRDHTVLKYHPFDPSSKWAHCELKKGEEVLYAAKGAPQVILGISENRERVKSKMEEEIMKMARKGYRTIGVAIGHDGKDESGVEWKMIGLIPLYDPPRHDTKSTIDNTMKLGVKVKMITGDQLAIAIETCRILEMGTRVFSAKSLKMDESRIQRKYGHDKSELVLLADGFAQVLPEDKFSIVQILQERKMIIGMTGDGVNDAAALKKADIGIAVAGSTDAARSAADIVLVASGLSVIVQAIKESRKIFHRMKSYVTYSITSCVRIVLTFLLLTLIFDFYFPTIAVVFFSLINDGTMIIFTKDRSEISPDPENWNLVFIYTFSMVLGVYLAASTVVYYLLIDKTGMWQAFGLPEINKGRRSGIIYLQVSITNLSMVFSARTRKFFFSSRPSTYLIVVFFIAQAVASVLGAYGLGGYEEAGVEFSGGRWGWVLATWIYSIIWIIPVDVIKHAILFIIQRIVKNPKKRLDLEDPNTSKSAQITNQSPED